MYLNWLQQVLISHRDYDLMTNAGIWLVRSFDKVDMENFLSYLRVLLVSTGFSGDSRHHLRFIYCNDRRYLHWLDLYLATVHHHSLTLVWTSSHCRNTEAIEVYRTFEIISLTNGSTVESKSMLLTEAARIEKRWLSSIPALANRIRDSRDSLIVLAPWELNRDS